ncbi:hypothetical protein BDW68DRAFT_7118 [Aspergillus falconensis]
MTFPSLSIYLNAFISRLLWCNFSPYPCSCLYLAYFRLRLVWFTTAVWLWFGFLRCIYYYGVLFGGMVCSGSCTTIDL